MNIFELCDQVLGTPALLIEKLTFENEQLLFVVASTNHRACCPNCKETSQSQHSIYWRYPQDLPWAEIPVVLQIKVKRFFCSNAACPKKTFAERFPDLVGWYARKTIRVTEKQRRFSVNMTAVTAEGLLQQEQIGLSDTTINRLVRNLPDPCLPPMRIIGVDDWAKRKGQRYGTILVDLERNQVIDLLQDRTADTLAAWLRQHPGIEIVSRDRSPTYADAIRRAAPEAVQVADRFHLLKNVSDMVYQLLRQEEKTVRKHVSVAIPQLELPAEEQVPHHRTLTLAEQRRQDRMQQVDQLRQAGWSQTAIAQHLNIHPKTVRRYLDRCSPLVHRARTGSVLDPFKPYLLERWNVGCRNAALLYREIRAKGFPGRLTLVRDFVHQLREATDLPTKNQEQGSDGELCVAAILNPPNLRTITWWIIKRPEERAENQEAILAKLGEEQPKIRETITLARKFAEIVRQQQVNHLDQWLKQAGESSYRTWRSFASGIKQDEAAVQAALTFRWSNGPTEGHVNRLKCLKRMMYGRAKDDLLRKRVFWQGELRFT